MSAAAKEYIFKWASTTPETTIHQGRIQIHRQTMAQNNARNSQVRTFYKAKVKDLLDDLGNGIFRLDYSIGQWLAKYRALKGIRSKEMSLDEPRTSKSRAEGLAPSQKDLYGILPELGSKIISKSGGQGPFEPFMF